MTDCTVYGLRSSQDGRIRYVGQTVMSLEKRLKNHLSHSRKYRHRHLSNWINSVIRSGYSVEIIVLRENATWNVSEIEVIAQLRADGSDLVNATCGGEGALGVHWTEDRRKKMSETMTGKKKSAEHVSNLSKAMRGRTIPPSVAEKISASLKGRVPKNLGQIQAGNKGITRPTELRKRISNSLKGRQVTSTEKLMANLEKAKEKKNDMVT